MILVTCFIWSGERAWQEPGTFKPEHVLGLKNMVAKHLTMPHQFVCICSANYIEALNGLGVDTFPLWGFPTTEKRQQFDCFVRLGLCGQPGAELAEAFGCDRFVNLDLDTVVKGPIDHIVEKALDVDFRIFGTQTHLWIKTFSNGLRRGFNGALWGGKLGGRPDFWEACFEQEKIDAACKVYIGSEQALISHLFPEAPLWSELDRISLKGNIEDWDMLMCCGPSQNKPWNHSKWRKLWWTESGLIDPRLLEGHPWRVGLRIRQNVISSRPIRAGHGGARIREPRPADAAAPAPELLPVSNPSPPERTADPFW